MEQFNNINFYQARRLQILDLLEETNRPMMLKNIKDLYKRKYAQDIPFSDVNDEAIHDWLKNIENIGTESRNNEYYYFVKKPFDKVTSTVASDNNKRKTSSPIVPQTAKRSRSAPGNEEVTTKPLGNQQSRQPRVVKFKDQPSYRNNTKTRSKSENRQTKIIGAPNMYGSILIGDDFMLGLAIYKLGFSASKFRGKLQSGYCVSGMTITEASRKVREMEDDRHKTAIIYIGSIDIAGGRELIQMMQDLTDLMRACAEKNIRPILCTIAELPNCMLGNRKETLHSYNLFICNNPFGIPSIDINKCFKHTETDEISSFYYMDGPRYVSGFNKPLVLWSKNGRERVHEMLMKNLGMALVATGNITFNYI